MFGEKKSIEENMKNVQYLISYFVTRYILKTINCDRDATRRVAI